VRFVDEHRHLGGVESICRVLTEHGMPIAPSGYWAAKARPPSARSVRDAELLAEIERIHADNYDVYGVRKVWHELQRRGHKVARCTVARLMRRAGLRGAARGGTKVRTTVAGSGHERATDKVNRNFTAECPNRTWVADFTYVAAWCGIVYVAFVVDVYSRAIVGWAAATNKRIPLVLNALDMALWRRDHDGHTVHDGLIHHSDAGLTALSL
jgi:putative transposase